MSERPCDRCGGPTRKKEIVSKREATKGRKFIVLECLSGCKSGDFPHTFFPPKDEADPRPKAAPGLETGEVTALLKEAVSVLKDIRRILANPGRIHVVEDELRPDEEVPFR